LSNGLRPLDPPPLKLRVYIAALADSADVTFLAQQTAGDEPVCPVQGGSDETHWSVVGRSRRYHHRHQRLLED
jgi:hypothetical protein